MAIKSLSFSRLINQNLKAENKAMERLASGKRINSAQDDAAGLAIAEALKADSQIARQAQNNISYAGLAMDTADAAAGQISGISVRLEELAMQASNGTLSDEQRGSINEEAQALKQEAQRIVETTEFNGQKLFSGESTTYQVGIDSSANSQVTLENVDIGASIDANLASLDLSSIEGARQAIDSISTFATSVTTARGEIGAASSRMEVAQSTMEVAEENMRAAESRIRDVDIAEEVANKTKFNILTQTAGQAMNNHKLQAESVLKLLG